MSYIIHQNIKTLIEESSSAYIMYTESGNMNTDFADFASLSYDDFRSLLGRPDMSQREIRRMLRKGCYSHRDHAPKSCWATYMAKYMTRAANTNLGS